MNRQNASATLHYLNPLHVYCRLRDLGLPSPVARTISSSYERILCRPVAQNAGAAARTPSR
ncbi:MAG: hypothetical protein Q7I92_12895 [Humidesulfovibrio sp.]|nr:hypothetical protein [Humidesulfovibrio sp.]